MKTRYFYIVLFTILFVGSCKQEPIIPADPTAPDPGPAPVAGSASFTKFVAVGNSFVAGMQGNALFNTGQASSLPKIMAKQFETVGGSTTFNQPDINSVNGFNPISSVTSIGLILGRMVLFDPDGAGPRTALPTPAKYPGASQTCPSPTVVTPALPAPYNTADLPSPFTGNKAALNNFGVPLIYLAQLLTPATGGPNVGAANPAYTPFYARFASNPSANGVTGSTIASDALAATGSFYLLWIGFDDVLLYAATGADGATAGTYPMTAAATFGGQFNFLINAFLTTPTLSTAKGVVGNIPNFTSLPFFTTVAWNAIALDEAKAATLTTNLATGYNAFLDGMVATNRITAGERDKRKLSYKAGNNPILLTDEELTDLTPFMAASPSTQPLIPYARARQATSADYVPLLAGSVLGTCFSNNPNALFGASWPLPDNYMVTASEAATILARTADFNTAITAAVATSNNRLTVADVSKGYADFVAAKAIVSDGVMITPSFTPPTGAFSEDGIHPNGRGYAFTANIFIDAINAKFGSTIPRASLAPYAPTGLPVNP